MEQSESLINFEAKTDRELLVLTAQGVNLVAKLQEEQNGQVKANTRNVRDMKIILITVCIVVGVLFGKEVPELLHLIL